MVRNSRGNETRFWIHSAFTRTAYSRSRRSRVSARRRVAGRPGYNTMVRRCLHCKLPLNSPEWQKTTSQADSAGPHSR
jgi:hypothetical protein